MAGKQTGFRYSYWFLFLYVNLWAWVGAALVTLVPAAFLLDAAAWPGMLKAEAIGLACGPALTVLFVTPLVLYFRTYAGPETLTGLNVFCLWSTVRWDSIRRIRPVNFAGLRYLRLKSDESRWEIWLPLFLADPHGFTDLVAEYAGEDHILTAALRDRFPPPDDDDSPSHGVRA